MQRTVFPGGRLTMVALLLSAVAGCQSLGAAHNPLAWFHPSGKGSPPVGHPARERLSTGPVTEKQRLQVQIAMARSAENQGQIDQAIKLYLDAVERDPRSIESQHRLAVLYDRKGDSDTSRRFYEAAVKLDPKNAEIQCDFGYSRYLQEDWPGAEEHLNRAIALRPDLSRAHNNLGLVLARTGREHDALKEFARAGCTEPAARSNLAYAMAIDGRWEESRQQFQLALNRAPNLEASQAGLAAVDSAIQRSQAPPVPPPPAESSATLLR